MDWDVMLGECHEGCCSEQSGSSLSPSGSQPAPRPPSPATLPARQTPPPAPPPPLVPTRPPGQGGRRVRHCCGGDQRPHRRHSKGDHLLVAHLPVRRGSSIGSSRGATGGASCSGMRQGLLRRCQCLGCNTCSRPLPILPSTTGMGCASLQRLRLSLMSPTLRSWKHSGAQFVPRRLSYACGGGGGATTLTPIAGALQARSRLCPPPPPPKCHTLRSWQLWCAILLTAVAVGFIIWGIDLFAKTVAGRMGQGEAHTGGQEGGGGAGRGAQPCEQPSTCAHTRTHAHTHARTAHPGCLSPPPRPPLTPQRRGG